ncbi:hypothetical protein MKW98_004941 [Papaver atlanticum]|uniref:Uncharacterized protein n=1 Tax=Papaver atlanticum TaxID=357466 RepID=A0AAD4SHJ2_9MAGN|nr:hypothetical protein MKW98_004941 [Papaver atlanticum]
MDGTMITPLISNLYREWENYSDSLLSLCFLSGASWCTYGGLLDHELFDAVPRHHLLKKPEILILTSASANASWCTYGHLGGDQFLMLTLQIPGGLGSGLGASQLISGNFAGFP